MNETTTATESIAAVDAALAPLAGFEVVEVPVEPVKPDLDSVCYTMNAAEVDAQAALYEIVAVLKNYKANLDTFANALNMYGEE
jgi:hypothetical protein